MSTRSPQDRVVPTEPPTEVDVRLVVTDMDGTLLDGAGHLPEGFWPLLAELHERGIVFAAASGRQYATLTQQFAHEADRLAYIAENGTMVVLDGEVVSLHPMDPDDVRRLVAKTREMRRDGYRVGGIRCGRRSAYIEASDPEFVRQVAVYYAKKKIVPDVLEPVDDTLKYAVFDADDAETGSGPVLRAFGAPNQVVVSTGHWLDIMAPGVNKGTAVRDLQQALDVTPAQTVVFGDYLNDLEMMSAADHSFAMANAHPAIIAAAGHVAPSNEDLGVVTTLRTMLGG
ncbi:Cof-type HAD-IIB family hydrolase [Propionicicella superfundia]|uniref:Cof-type HAD-IIB family hydrolase n=1 Tax=Propionicicella superfundia TaxID=348582 RepID=UPI000427AC90|nr:Cof-type HAD-IIB family hydrolase [Propionicicella superfundia]